MFKKILIFILVFVIASGIGAGYFFLYQEKEREAGVRKDLELALDGALKDRDSIKAELDRIKEEYDKINRELGNRITANKELSGEIEVISSDLKEFQFEIDILQQERDVLLKRLEEQQLKLDNYTRGSQAKKIEEESGLPDEEDKVKLENITVAEEEALEKEEPLKEEIPAEVKEIRVKAEIMAFNREYGFVVLNRGTKDGLDINRKYIFSIQGQVQGELKPDRIYDSMAVMDVLKGRENVAEGMTIELVSER